MLAARNHETPVRISDHATAVKSWELSELIDSAERPKGVAKKKKIVALRNIYSLAFKCDPVICSIK